MACSQVTEPRADEEHRLGAGFRLTLACPQCDAVGWIDWKSLKNGIRCPRCKCQFLIGPDGKVVSQADLRQVRFECPRCRQVGKIPAMLAIRRAECAACRLPLVRGPDQRLHGVKEAAELRRTVHEMPQERTLGARVAEHLVADDGRLRWLRVVLWIGLVATAAAGAVLVAHRLFDSSVETEVRRFTSTCLTGEWRDAEDFLPDDDVQRAEFNRWRVRHFPSIIDAHRPPGDRVSVIVESTASAADRVTFLVTLRSDFIGERCHQQCWTLLEEEWRFDVVATLLADDSQAGG